MPVGGQWMTPMGGGEPEWVPDSLLPDAIQSGVYRALPGDTQVAVTTGEGVAGATSLADLESLQTGSGVNLQTGSEFRANERGARLEREHGGALATAGTFVEQAADTATLGIYGGATDLVLGDEYTEARAERLEANPTAGKIGEVAGAAAPAILSIGAGTAGAIARATPAGAATRIAEAIVAKGAGRGVIGRAAATAAGGAAEGAIFGSGHVVAESVLHDKDLSAEAFIAGAKEGALWGGAAGGAASLLSSGAKAAKEGVESYLGKTVELKEAQAAAKADAKASQAAASEAKQARARADRLRNQQIIEKERQANRIQLAEKRGATAKELEQIKADSRQKLAELGSETELEKVAQQAEVKLTLAREKASISSEQLAKEQVRLERAKVVSKAKVETAEIYTGGWRDVNKSKLAQRQVTKETAEVAADARLRTGLADARVSAVTDDAARYVEDLTPEGMLAKGVDEAAEEGLSQARQSAGMPLKDMVPARLRTPKAIDAARADVVTQVARHQATTEDLLRQVDEIIAVNPAAADDLMPARQAAAESMAAASAWSQKAASGIDSFDEGFQAIRGAEQAQHDLAQVMRAQSEAAGIPAPHLDAVTKGMDDAVGKTDEIVTGAIAKNVEAATTSAGGGATQKVAGLDLLLQLGGMPNAEDIPVIGPYLSAYLKFRAATGGGHVRFPGTVGRIASIAAQTQNKAGEVVAAIVARAPAAAKVAERAAPSLTSTLSRPLWEPLDSERPAPGSGQVDQFRLYKKRIEELDRAMGDPDGTRQKIIDSIPAPPTVAAAVADAEMRKLEYLHGLVDVDPRAPTIAGKPAPANRVEVQRFAEAKRAVENPVESIKDFIDGRSGAAVVDAVRTVFPRLFASMQEQLVEKVAESDQPIAFSRLVRAALVFDVPLTHATTAEYGFNRQAEYAEQKAAAQQPSAGGGQLRLSQNEELGSMRRAMR